MSYQPKSYRKFLATSVATAVVVSSFAGAASANAKFSDVEQGEWYTDAVEKMAEADIVKGLSAGVFGVDRSLERRDAVLLLSRIFDWDLEDAPATTFEDLGTDEQYLAPIAKAADLGIVNGRDGKHFDPRGSLTRGEMAAILTRALELEKDNSYETPFTDIAEFNGFYEDFIKAIFKAGLTEGVSSTEFGTGHQVTRAQFATFLYRDEMVKKIVEDKIAANEELVVSSVTASSEKIKKAEKQQLTITVNDSTEVTVEELVEAGYKVEFLYNKTAAPFNTDDAKTLGVIDASGLTESFRYAVKVTNAEGQSMTSSQQTVESFDENKVVEVTEVALFSEGNQYELDYVTKNNQGLNFGAISGLNAFGEVLTTEDDDAQFPAIENVTSSNISVAYYQEEEGLEVVDLGTVVMSVEFTDIEEVVNYTIQVVEDQKPAAIVEDGETRRYTLNKENDTFTILDQYGEIWKTEGEVDYTISSDVEDFVKVEGNLTVTEEGKVIVDFDAIDEAGEYTITFEKDEETLGQVTVIFVELDHDTVDVFTLTTDKESIDLVDAVEEGQFNSDSEELIFTATLAGSFEGITLTEEEIKEALTEIDGELEVKSSDVEVATVANDIDVTDSLEFDVKAESVGTTTITLEQVEGDFTTVLASITLSVTNSTPQISQLSLAENVESLEIMEGENGWEVVDATQLVSADVTEVEANMIRSITFSSSDQKAIVRMSSLFGGKEFIVDAVESEQE